METLRAEPTSGPDAEKALVSFAREGMKELEVIGDGLGYSNCPC